MESIIIFVLIAIASTVFQAIGQKAKQQKRTTTNNQASKPYVFPTAKAINKSDSSCSGTVIQNTVPPILKTPFHISRMNMESESLMERIKTKTIEDVVIKEQYEEPASVASSTFLDSINFDELQRSIVMAEVLGKPKALRKASR